VVGRTDDFYVDKDHCPLLCAIIELHMTVAQLKNKANKGDYPGKSTPASSTKAEKTVALLRTACRRAANYIRDGVASSAGPFKLFHDVGHSDMKELRALLTKVGCDALDTLLTSTAEHSLQARQEWLACVDCAYYKVIGMHDINALTKGGKVPKSSKDDAGEHYRITGDGSKMDAEDALARAQIDFDSAFAQAKSDFDSALARAQGDFVSAVLASAPN
jgi:hypothetical protein